MGERPRPNVTSKATVVQAVLHTVTEGSFVHFSLACGHLITVEKGDLKGPLPTQMKCWACVQEKEKS